MLAGFIWMRKGGGKAACFAIGIFISMKARGVVLRPSAA
jgi:hypothetical protein